MKAVLLDMGGVLLFMAHSKGFPAERLDFRGRQAMLQRIRRDGGHLQGGDLERLVFAPWRLEYSRRVSRGAEAEWSPHLDRLRREVGVGTADMDLLRAWFRPYGDHLELIDGVEAALAELRRQGMRLAIVSNVPLPGELYVEVLRRCSIAQYFERMVFSYDVGCRKPSPAMLRLALSALDVETGAAVMVGDRRDRDVAAGRAAGLATVWVRSEDGSGPLPDRTVESLQELPALLEGW